MTKQKSAAKPQLEAESEPVQTLEADSRKVELLVHIDFQSDDKGVHIAPGIVLSHQIPEKFLQELIENKKAKFL